MILKLLPLILVMSALGTLQASSSTAKSDFPITEIRWFMFHRENSPSIRFAVPDKDTTWSAYGGTLRRYDVHVAKMFEVTHFLCKQRENFQWIDWFYEAANGKVNMGHFKIRCSLAKDIAIAYGLDRFEQTTIKQELEGDDGNGYQTRVPSKQYFVPALNLRGNKISKWTDFVQQFRPDYTAVLANTQIPIQQMLEPLREKIPVPIFLPSYWSSSQAIYVSLESRKDGYTAQFTSVIGGGGTASYIGSVSAYKGNKLMAPYSSLKSRFKDVRLAHKKTGTAFSFCGNTCMAVVQWRDQGVIYEVHGKGDVSKLVEVADNAIEAGAR